MRGVAPLVASVRHHRKRQLEEQLRAGARWSANGLVFSTTIGTPLEAQNIVNRHFKPLLRRAGLPDIRWHDLRHTYATLLLARAVHSTFVQKSLGHASVQRVAEGKIAELWGQEDMLGMMQQLGAIPERGQSEEVSPA